MVSSRGLDPLEIPRCIFCQGRAQSLIQAPVSDSSKTTDNGHPAQDQEQPELNNASEDTAMTDRDAGQEDLPAFELYTALLGEIPGLWDLIPKHLDEWIKDIYQSSGRWMIFIERLERIQKPTTEDKLCRALALRGLALQFSIFESHCIPRRNKKRDGKIPKFVRDHLCAPEKEIKRISHYIQAGQKHLKIEEAFRHELKQRQSIYAGEAYSGRGISALTALAITPFRNLQLGEIPRFVEKFFANGAKIKLRLPFPLIGPSKSIEKEFCLLEVVERASRWFTELQSCFLNVTIPGDRCKRRRLSSYRADTPYTMSAMCGSVSTSEVLGSLSGPQNVQPGEVLHISDPNLNDIEMSHFQPPAIDAPFQFGSSDHSTSYFARDELFGLASNSIVSQTGETNEANATMEETTGFDPLSSVALFTFPLDSTLDQTGEMNGANAAMQETTGLDPLSSDALFISQIDNILDQTGEIDETNATMEETTGFDPLSSVALFTFPLDSTLDQTGEMNGTNAAMQEKTGLDPLSSDAIFISQIDSTLDQTGEINETNVATQETKPLISDNRTGQSVQAEQETAKNILSALFPDFQNDSISSEAGQMPLTPHTTSSDSVIVQAGHNVITV
ncbi:hypothetical protein N7509_000291 [Penicillium cosmopolitanum]|uniref:Uncharacterized protein n=1 Tax=Penicillium cosmopolitanum TaxID=1131564 RepID=A0A9W9WA03_9EURO|nr:uncharacterized protein N7509_012737 [Penicillium cosmopolitanum]XP_056493520.1 uncharacterized protein N7509_000291 [Penicillium cosmopolitanum]KAJ5379618.1 hypothetical protein N7509_012737 [Penicillium cosmopolitanum]KAJ5413664.1 hypothetical protein N7509_000291 [Penicillium cosmopolitanum]